jgi:hypothetical protein
MDGNNRKLTFQEWLSAYGNHLERVCSGAATQAEAAAPQKLNEPSSLQQQG